MQYIEKYCTSKNFSKAKLILNIDIVLWISLLIFYMCRQMSNFVQLTIFQNWHWVKEIDYGSEIPSEMLWLHTGILCNSRILIAIEWSQKQEELVSCFQWCIKHNCWLFFKLFQESHQHQGLLAGSCHLQRQQTCVISSVSLVIHVVSSYHSVMDFRYLQVSKIKESTIIDICHKFFSEENVIDNISVGKPQMSILECLIWYQRLHSIKILF